MKTVHDTPIVPGLFGAVIGALAMLAVVWVGPVAQRDRVIAAYEADSIRMAQSATMTRSVATGCGIPAETVQRYELMRLVKNMEKEEVTNVDLIGPGIAVISHGGNGKKVTVTYGFLCSAHDSPEALGKNPTGFSVYSYYPNRSS